MNLNFKKYSSFIFLFIFISLGANAQKLKKADKIIIENLKTTVSFLADDKLEGRRTGTKGEQLAYEYLSERFTALNLLPKGDNGGYVQSFTIHEGREISPSSFFYLNNHSLKLGEDYFPLNISKNGSDSAIASPSLYETGVPWFLDIKEILEENKNNPHFDLVDALKKKAEDLKSRGATSVILFNSGNISDELSFDSKSKLEAASLPIIYLTKAAVEKYLSQKDHDYKIHFKISIGDKTRKAHNVVGYIDNGAPNTIVIGAHYDHLGYGEDRNSLWTGQPEIHNGADDNASGTAMVVELARILSNSKWKNNNYLFVCFSGEELGLFGSKYFVDNAPIPLSEINFMINMDMVGRLNETSHGLTVGGYGTSPLWGNILSDKEKNLSIKFDSSGIGPSDHTSFYLKNIPVLFFFTGSHADYHKPTDDVDKINFVGQLYILKYIENIIEQTNKSGKLLFTKTREPQMGGGTKFTVSLGIMPDYTFSESGVRVDGVISGRVAEKAGMLAGDIIIQLGDYKVTSVEDYMTALSHFKKGDATTVKIKRGEEEKIFEIVF